jgi:hypothetical protein
VVAMAALADTDMKGLRDRAILLLPLLACLGLGARARR